MSDERQWYEYDGVVLAETAKSVGVGQIACDVEHWLPKSQLGAISYAEGGDSKDVRVGAAIVAVELPEWLADKKGLQASDDVIRQPQGTPHLPGDEIPF